MGKIIKQAVEDWKTGAGIIKNKVANDPVLKAVKTTVTGGAPLMPKGKKK